jgi:soluble lytic murein transglycosylase-like protein
LRLVRWIPVAVALTSCSGDARADELLYYVRGNTVVITNVADRPDAKPLPFAWSGSYRTARLPATPYDPFIEKVAAENGLDPNVIKAVALVESGFNPLAVSPKGARGIMQFMPATARRYGVRNLDDPYEGLRAGARHLRDLLDEFGGDLTLALAAYNAGSGAVKRHGGVPAYRETQDYVRKVRSALGKAGRTRKEPPRESPAAPLTVREQADGTLLITN